MNHNSEMIRGGCCRLARQVLRMTCVLGLALCLAESASGVTFHWSASSYRIYVTGPGTASLSDVKAAVPNAPLTQVAPAVWHLRANLVVEQGAKLVLHGTKIGGDVNVLRLQSNNTTDTNAILYISVDYGTIDIRSTSITSWDDAVDGPDLEYDLLGRSHIRVRSSLDPDGVTAHESRMDIIDSDIGYLGWHHAESYGLVWKVSEPKVNPGYGNLTNLYSLVNVYGNVLRSRIHHNYFAHYSFGSYGQIMTDNELDHNVGYGFDPHDDSDYIVVERNNVHHNGWHGIIASQRCNNFTVRNNISWANGRNGIMLHRYCDNSIVENNRCFDNGDAGIAVFDTQRALVRNNICQRNFTAGIRLSVGPANNTIEGNEFSGSPNYGIYLYKGVDAPFPGDNGHPKRNIFINNRVHQNTGPGIFLTTADDNTFLGNVFHSNDDTLWFVNGQRNIIDSNTIPTTTQVRLQGLPNLLASAIVRNQPALSVQLDAYSTVTFQDNSGRIFDPEEPGVATTVTPTGSSLLLTTLDITKTSFVRTRSLSAVPDAGVALVTVTVWNTTGDLSKRWFTQAGAATHRMTYKVGDLSPNTQYQVFKDGVPDEINTDATGTLTFTDDAVTPGVVEFVVML
jgi:parallel beta-helix repeat protein